jgi:hypothetical protein
LQLPSAVLDLHHHLAARIDAGLARREDRAMITAQSQAIDADPEAPMLPLAMDAAVVRFRRLVA